MKSKRLLLATVLTLFGLATCVQAQDFLTNGLIAYYPFNGNANDQSGYANNGTPHNAALTSDRLNQANAAYAFNGVNTYISAPNQSYLTFPNGGDFTISLWASIDMLPTAPDIYRAMVALDNGTGAQPKWGFAYGQLAVPPPVGYSSNYIHFHTSGNDVTQGYWLACAPYTPVLGAWHNYLITKAGSTYTLYIDGVKATGTTNYLYANGSLQANVAGPSQIISGITAPLTIGWAEGPGSFTDGQLDDVRIYNRALPSNEVAQLYAIEYGPRVDLIKAVKPSFYNLTLTTNYQMQLSGDMATWTNYGSPFTATNTTMIWPQYFDVNNWNSLFFRLQVAP